MRTSLKYIKTIIPVITIIAIVSLIYSGCEKTPYFGPYECEYCYQVEPDTGDLIIDVTLNDENPYVPLFIYKGKLEEDELVKIDTAFDSTTYVGVPVNQYYTVKAQYIAEDGKTIYAIDGEMLETKKEFSLCDKVCYWAEDYYDVKLRY